MMESYIYLENLAIYACHGVNPQETKVGNTFLINLKIKTNIEKAMTTDDVADTISYADIYQIIAEEMAIPSKLLEHVAGRMVKRIFREFVSIEAIHLQLSKQNPPMGADISAAGIELQCDRQYFSI